MLRRFDSFQIRLCIACKIKQDVKAYAITRGNKLHRITFSKPLAEHIIKSLAGGYELKRIHLKLGKRLEPGELSSTGLYALATTECGHMLRVQLDRQVSDVLCDNDTRYIAECWGKIV